MKNKIIIILLTLSSNLVFAHDFLKNGKQLAFCHYVDIARAEARFGTLPKVSKDYKEHLFRFDWNDFETNKKVGNKEAKYEMNVNVEIDRDYPEHIYRLEYNLTYQNGGEGSSKIVDEDIEESLANSPVSRALFVDRSASDDIVRNKCRKKLKAEIKNNLVK